MAGGFPLFRSNSYVNSIDVISNISSLSLGSKRWMEDHDIEVFGKKVRNWRELWRKEY